jgi:hypothetical protein
VAPARPADHAGGGERVGVLRASQRAGDAAGPLLHVGAGGVVHVVIGDDVGDGEAARLMTQLEMTTSTLASSNGISSM